MTVWEPSSTYHRIAARYKARFSACNWRHTFATVTFHRSDCAAQNSGLNRLATYSSTSRWESATWHRATIEYSTLLFILLYDIAEHRTGDEYGPLCAGVEHCRFIQIGYVT